MPNQTAAAARLVAGAVEAFALPLSTLAPELAGIAPAPLADTDLDWRSLDPHAVGGLYQREPPNAAGDERELRGAFYTPQTVARLLADEAIPLTRTPSGKTPVCLDPACGCGSLLIEAMRHLCRHRDVPPAVAAAHLRGYDRDQASVVMARLALVITARELGACALDLESIAALLARNVAARDVLLDVPTDQVDCVLINPPYVRAARSGPERDRIRRTFRTAVGAFDLHVPFVELALRCLRPGGAFGLLTSNKLLVADYAARIRFRLARATTLVRLIDLEHCEDAAPGAQISQLITTGVAHPPPSNHKIEVLRPRTVDEVSAGGGASTDRDQQRLVGARWPTIRASTSEERIIARMTSPALPRLRSVALVRGGVRGFDYEQCCRELVDALDRPGTVPVITPGNIRAYRAPSDGRVRLAGRMWAQPALAGRPDAVPEKLWRLFMEPKLVVKGVGARPTGAWCPAPAALFVAVWGIWGDEQLLWAVLALLNSHPVAWLHYQQLAGARIPRGSLRIPMAWLAELPVPAEGLEELAALARRRCAAEDAGEQRDLQGRIDRAAARSYDLTEADVSLMAKAPIRPVQT